MRILDLNMLDLGEPGVSTQPGLSAFQNKKWCHGARAFEICRQDPQSVRFDVWENLSLDPVKLPGGMRHVADLAVGQLQTVCGNLSKDVWTVFTPVHWDRARLQIFLGVAAACQMDVRALMPRVLAVDHAAGLAEVEWHWHQRFTVNLEHRSEGLHVAGFSVSPEGGVLDLFRRQSRAAARWALETHRLDPMHSGASEQKLFEGWWNWRRGGGAWRFQSGELDVDFSTSVSFEDINSVLSKPLQSVEGRLGDLSQPGARYKEFLPDPEG